jgi:hypothetical protein
LGAAWQGYGWGLGHAIALIHGTARGFPFIVRNISKLLVGLVSQGAKYSVLEYSGIKWNSQSENIRGYNFF